MPLEANLDSAEWLQTASNGGGFSAAAEDQKWRFACISETNPRKLISEFTVIAPL